MAPFFFAIFAWSIIENYCKFERSSNMATKIEYATLTIYLSNGKTVEVKNVRFDTMELTDTNLTFKDLNQTWYVIPVNSLLYYTFVMTD